MSARARHEKTIKRLDSQFGGELEDAVTKLLFKHGLDWLTDEQHNEVWAEMVQTEWSRRQRMYHSHGRNVEPLPRRTISPPFPMFDPEDRSSESF